MELRTIPKLMVMTSVLAATLPGCALHFAGDAEQAARDDDAEDDAAHESTPETPASAQAAGEEGGGDAQATGAGGGDGAAESTGSAQPVGAAPEEPALPGLVTFELIDMLVQPWDVDQEEWDNSNKVSSAHVDALASALSGSSMYGAAAAFVYDVASAHYSKPDPYGETCIIVDAVEQSCFALPPSSNTFHPSLGGGGWQHVPLDPGIRIRLRLIDADPDWWSKDDYIGTVEINYADLMAALESQQIHQVPVFDQDHGTILFVGISVQAEQ